LLTLLLLLELSFKMLDYHYHSRDDDSKNDDGEMLAAEEDYEFEILQLVDFEYDPEESYYADTLEPTRKPDLRRDIPDEIWSRLNGGKGALLRAI
jgi:hypothetical protein